MARYFKSLNRPEGGRTDFPTYGVMSDAPIQHPFRGEEHPYGTVEMQYKEVSERPNFTKSGNNTKHNPTELFEHQPATLTVNSMFTDHRLRPHMMTVMALAMKDHPDAQLVAGSSLTSFSSDLSRHAHKKGLVTPHRDNPEMKTEYEQEYGAPHAATAKKGKFEQSASPGFIQNHLMGHYAEEIPHSEVMAGKQFLKQVLRPGVAPKARKQTPKTQSEQLKLPGI